MAPLADPRGRGRCSPCAPLNEDWTIDDPLQGIDIKVEHRALGVLRVEVELEVQAGCEAWKTEDEDS